MKVYIDIETIPDQRPGALDECIQRVRPPAQYKKADSIAEWIRENAQPVGEEDWRRTALDAAAGQVWCFGIAIEGHDPSVVVADGFGAASEARLLRDVMESLSYRSGPLYERPTLIGHNVVGFDLPFLYRRCVVHGVRPPMWFPRNPKPWSEMVEDTMHLWAGDRGTISLDRLARTLGLAGKGEMTGADVWPALAEGRAKEVAEYCRADVALTREVHRRLTFTTTTEE